VGSRTLAAGAFLLAATAASAQSEGGKFGVAVSGVGDVNGDGVPDVVVGAPEARPGGRYDAGQATVYSGKDGSVLHSFAGTSSIEFLGASVAGPGDLNGDGKPEIAVGAPRASQWKGSVRAFSGKNGSLLWEAVGATKGEALGTALSVTGDMNADGVPDLLAGAPSASVGGREHCGVARVLSGKDGKALLTLEGEVAWESFGTVVAPAGDVNGDGKPDIAVGGWFSPHEHTARASSLRLFSGKDGALLFTVPAQDNSCQATSAAVIGDRDGDGIGDLVLGMPMATRSGHLAGGGIRIRSGANGRILVRAAGRGTNFDTYGLALALAGDMNGDGFTDFWVSASGGEAGAEDLGNAKDPAGRIELVSGKDMVPIRIVFSKQFGEMLGAALAVPGDLDKDGVPDLLAGAPGAGVARVYSGKDGSVLLTLSPPPEK